MKKILGIVLAISILFSVILSGCNNKNNAVSYEKEYIDYSTDMQIMYHVSGNAPMTKSDKGYYYIGDDGIVIFIDKETKKATPLCSKPNCTHDALETCDAYLNLTQKPNTLIGAPDSAIQYYNGYLYALCGEYDKSYIKYNTYLMRMKPDGSQRENITGYFDFYAFEWFIHKGYLYCSTDSSIFRIPLDSPKTKPQVIYKTEYYVESSLRAVCQLRAYKNYLYFTADERNEDNEGPGSSTNYINLDTLEIKSFSRIKDNRLNYMFFLDDTLIACYYDSESDENVYLKCDLEGNVKEEFFTITHIDLLFYSTDGKYIYGDNRSRTDRGEDKQQIIKVYDLNMNEIDSYVPPKFETVVCNYINPQDNEYFIFESVDDSGERILVMADKSQIGNIGGKTIEYTELCKLEWKEKTEGNYISIGGE